MSPSTQKVVKNMYHQLKLENNGSNYGVVERIHVLTKISKPSIRKVLKSKECVTRKKRNQRSLVYLDHCMMENIRRRVYNFYSRNVVPSFDAIKNDVKLVPGFPYKSKNTIRKVLHSLGFRYRMLNRRQSIMESQRIIILRNEYLNKIDEARRQNRFIVYLDETWYDTHDIAKKGWSDQSAKCLVNAPPNRGKRIIILHVGNENGFLPNCLLLSAKNILSCSADYHQDMTSALFEKWFEEQLIPNLPPNAVIVMDNAPYHSRQTEIIPKAKARKGVISTFLDQMGVSYPPTALKKDLLALLKGLNIKPNYVVDEMATAFGHTVIRLPPYYCTFNPIELIWSHIKREVRKKMLHRHCLKAF